MSSGNLKLLALLLVSAASIVRITMASDPDILTDFMAPSNKVDGGFFTFTGFRALTKPPPSTFTVTKATMKEFPALNGQSVSYAALQFPAGTINPPHTHPRAAELLLVAEGTLRVGFVDTTNKLFTSTLQAGDMFIFPKGLVHFQQNADTNKTAAALSVFGSANPGLVSIPNALFATAIDETVLALAFKTNAATIQTLKKGFTPE